MKKSLYLLLLILPLATTAQIELKKTSLAPFGGSSESGNLSIVHIAGEIANKENNQGNYHLSEGFIGPDLTRLLGLNDYEILSGIKVFPVPVSNVLNVQLGQSGTYEIYLFDLTGKQLSQTQTNEKQITLEMSHLPAANYILMVIDRKNKTYKYIKIQKN